MNFTNRSFQHAKTSVRDVLIDGSGAAVGAFCGVADWEEAPAMVTKRPLLAPAIAFAVGILIAEPAARGLATRIRCRGHIRMRCDYLEIRASSSRNRVQFVSRALRF